MSEEKFTTWHIWQKNDAMFKHSAGAEIRHERWKQSFFFISDKRGEDKAVGSGG